MVDVLMVCVGSRGDTQPFVDLALALKAAGISSVVAAHPEFEGFVQAAGCCFAPVRSSLPEALRTTAAGKQMREESGSAGLKYFPALFNRLFQDWFQETLQLAEKYKPRILLLTLMPYLAGGFRVPELIEQRLKEQQQQQQQQQQHGERSQPTATERKPQLLVVYTVPAHPTWAFVPPSTGIGLSTRLGIFNRLLW
ncbi:hypothetical protein OEZ85_013148 [Tetradesmus obliquus]|uniref:Glycosyltransferase family 28 N-terminal domain-containing protein n=1 Tax=Tetradesmus obliquus TaxID=3088 RepID=A0ABY8U4T3_TETOB|nr:hypothetical protein OEZ85_013148 [Tetradesmus obliquus]